MFLAGGDGRGIWCIPGVCLYLAGHTSVPPRLEGVAARARAGHVMSAGAPALGMGPEPRSTMRCAFRVGDGSKGRCRLDCPECAPWCGWVVVVVCPPRVVIDAIVWHPGWWFPGAWDGWQVLEVCVHVVL